MGVRLDDVDFFNDDLNKLFKAWREAIENANNWRVTGACGFEAHAGAGFSLHIPKGTSSPVMAAVATSTISAAPSADKMGTGTAVLRIRDGDDLSDGEEVNVFSNFTKSIPSGSRMELGWDGKGWHVIGANCPTV